MPDQNESGEPALKFISELPHPKHNRLAKAFQYRQFSIKYYKNPKSLGEIVAGISSLYKYPQAAVVESCNEPMLMIRTEEGIHGEVYLYSFSRNGFHKNFGTFPHTDTATFLQSVIEEISKLDKIKGNPTRDIAADRVIVHCPSCNSALRVPKGKSGTIRCKTYGELFEART